MCLELALSRARSLADTLFFHFSDRTREETGSHSLRRVRRLLDARGVCQPSRSRINGMPQDMNHTTACGFEIGILSTRLITTRTKRAPLFDRLGAGDCITAVEGSLEHGREIGGFVSVLGAPQTGSLLLCGWRSRSVFANRRGGGELGPSRPATSPMRQSRIRTRRGSTAALTIAGARNAALTSSPACSFGTFWPPGPFASAAVLCGPASRPAGHRGGASGQRPSQK